MTSPKHFPTDDLRHSLFYKAGSAAHHKSATSSKQSSTTSLKDGLNNANTYHFQNTFLDNNVMSDLEESPVLTRETLFKTLVLVLVPMQLNLVFNPQRHCLLLYCRVDYQIVTSPAFSPSNLIHLHQ